MRPEENRHGISILEYFSRQLEGQFSGDCHRVFNLLFRWGEQFSLQHCGNQVDYASCEVVSVAFGNFGRVWLADAVEPLLDMRLEGERQLKLEVSLHQSKAHALPSVRSKAREAMGFATLLSPIRTDR
jgi:hypothetical protein